MVYSQQPMTFEHCIPGAASCGDFANYMLLTYGWKLGEDQEIHTVSLQH